MPYMKRQSNKKWFVYKKGPDGEPVGKPLGEHESESDADSQLAALYASGSAKKSLMSCNLKGGQGSGNFGHVGREGERGGSGSSGESKADNKPDRQRQADLEISIESPKKSSTSKGTDSSLRMGSKIVSSISETFDDPKTWESTVKISFSDRTTKMVRPDQVLSKIKPAFKASISSAGIDISSKAGREFYREFIDPDVNSAKNLFDLISNPTKLRSAYNDFASSQGYSILKSWDSTMKSNSETHKVGDKIFDSPVAGLEEVYPMGNDTCFATADGTLYICRKDGVIKEIRQKSQQVPYKSLDSIDGQIVFGSNLKVMGDGRIGGHLILFGKGDETDFYGDYFDHQTYVGPDHGNGRDVTMNHRKSITTGDFDTDQVLKTFTDRLFKQGGLKTRPDDLGIFGEVVCNLSDAYDSMVYGLVEKGKLKWSAGAPGHLVDRASDGRLKMFVISEGALTPIPAEPRMVLHRVMPLKSLSELFEKSTR